MTINSRDLRDAYGAFATGVAVVTARAAGGAAFGITINSMTSLSLDPPLLLWNLRKDSQISELWRDVDRFVVNVLASGQHDLCWQFAAVEPVSSELEEWNIDEPAMPRLDGCLAWYDCLLEQCYPGGDHVINVGRVVAIERDTTREPLIVFGGQLFGLGEAKS